MALDRRLKVTIHLESPMLITARRVGFVWESETFVPGGVLRGAVAEVATRHGQDLKLLFDRPNGPCFGHADAALTSPVGILSHTARTCKRYRGFRRDDQDEERHGVCDTLLSQAFSQAQAEAVCPFCGQDTVPYGGEPYVSIGLSEAQRYVSPRVVLRRIGRTAVARERGAVADRLLYTLEVIGEQMERDELDAYGRPLQAAALFHGFVWVDSSDGWPWCDWLQEVTHLGGARSRGLGRVRIEAEENLPITVAERDLVRAAMQLAGSKPMVPSDHPTGKMNVLDRILAFNRAVYALGSLKEEQRAFWYFTVDLQSGTALGDARGPRFCLEPSDLGFLPSDQYQGAECWRWWARYGQAGGWSVAWGLPKPVAPVLTAGSTFLYRVTRSDENLMHRVLERCVALECEGVGQRREEGLGWVQICTPFHLETEVRK